jgi:protein TonB
VVVFGGALYGGRIAYVNLQQIRAWVATASVATPAPSGAPAAAPTVPVIGLRAQRQNGDLLVTWDRNSAVVARATSGAVQIRDGHSQREIRLSAAQVQSGSVLYSPMSDQIQIDVTVAGPSSSISESVLVILPANGTPVVKPQAPRQAAVAAPLSAPANPPAQPPKPFTPPPDRHAAAATPAPSMDQAPPLVSSSVSAPALPASLSVPPPVARPQSQSATAAAQTPVNANTPVKPPVSDYHAAEAISKVTPGFPSALRSVILKPQTVQVRLSISETGKVTKAEGIRENGIHGLLFLEAVRAASAWKFLPARLGNRPIASEMVVSFTFHAPPAE